MGTIRVTPRLMVDRVLSNLNAQTRRVLTLQDQLATGQKVNRPSDDPLAARRAVAARALISQNEQYLTNISTLTPNLSETETAVMTVENTLQRAKELALQGGSTTNGQLQRDQIATEVNQLLESVLVESNHVTNGRYVFGGTRTLNTPFEETRNAQGEITGVTFEGNDETYDVEIYEGIRMKGNEPGRAVFMQTSASSVDIFQTLIDLRDNLRAGDINALTGRIDELNNAQDQLMLSVTRLGTIQNRLEDADSNLRAINDQLEQVVSDNIDADFAEVVINLNAQSNAYQAALNAAGRVIQPSLLDFIG